MEKYLAQHVDGIEWSWSSWHPLDQSYTWASTAYNLPLTVNVRLPESLPRLFSRSSLYTPPSDLSASLIVRNACLSVTWDTKIYVLLGSISQSSSRMDCTNWKWTEYLSIKSDGRAVAKIFQTTVYVKQHEQCGILASCLYCEPFSGLLSLYHV